MRGMVYDQKELKAVRLVETCLISSRDLARKASNSLSDLDQGRLLDHMYRKPL